MIRREGTERERKNCIEILTKQTANSSFVKLDQLI